MIKEPILEILNLSFGFGKNKILNDISLQIWPGELVLLCGESGAGKSTLVKVLCGHYPANGGVLNSGQILVSGQDITDLNTTERSQYMTTIFQNARGSFCMSNLRQEIIFCLENLETPPHNIDLELERVIEKFNLSSIADREFDYLSGGELELCALAIAELYPGNLHILDEPFANLDDEAMHRCRGLIENWRSKGKAVLVIDHRLEHWKECTGKLLLDRKGQLVQVNEDNLFAHGLHVDWKPRPVNEGQNTKASESKEEPILQLRDFSLLVGGSSTGILRRKWRGGERIVHSDVLDIPGNKLVALTGSSGSGKTSFFRALLGECAYSGKIFFAGDDLGTLKRRDVFQRIGIVFQDPALQFVQMDVASEIAFSVKLGEKSDAALEEVADSAGVDSLLERYGLQSKTKVSPWLLSQGEQRRLAVLTMLPGSRKLLLVDEPTYGQDIRHGVEIMETLQDLIRHGISCIFTSHDRTLISRYADCEIEIDKGEMRRIR